MKVEGSNDVAIYFIGASHNSFLTSGHVGMTPVNSGTIVVFSHIY